MDAAGNPVDGGLTQIVAGGGGREPVNPSRPRTAGSQARAGSGALRLDLGPDDAAFRYDASRRRRASRDHRPGQRHLPPADRRRDPAAAGHDRADHADRGQRTAGVADRRAGLVAGVERRGRRDGLRRTPQRRRRRHPRRRHHVVARPRARPGPHLPVDGRGRRRRRQPVRPVGAGHRHHTDADAQHQGSAGRPADRHRAPQGLHGHPLLRAGPTPTATGAPPRARSSSPRRSPGHASAAAARSRVGSGARATTAPSARASRTWSPTRWSASARRGSPEPTAGPSSPGASCATTWATRAR